MLKNHLKIALRSLRKHKGYALINSESNIVGVDSNFLDFFDFRLLSGHPKTALTAPNSVILTQQTARKYFGDAPALGKLLTLGEAKQVFGKDFNFMTLRAPIMPFALFHSASESYQIPDSYVVVRLTHMDLEAGIKLLASEWRAVVPDMPFEYQLLDERFNEQYRAEQRLGRMFFVFSLLTIFIACIGLLGLAAFTAEQRTKEIGIRKVLGASVPAIVALLSTDFLRLVGLAFVVAVPIAYLVMSRWLEDFANHVTMGPGVFLLAGLLALLIALLTVSYQAIRAALADPVQSLRYE